MCDVPAVEALLAFLSSQCKDEETKEDGDRCGAIVETGVRKMLKSMDALMAIPIATRTRVDRGGGSIVVTEPQSEAINIGSDITSSVNGGGGILDHFRKKERTI